MCAYIGVRVYIYPGSRTQILSLNIFLASHLSCFFIAVYAHFVPQLFILKFMMLMRS